MASDTCFMVTTSTACKQATRHQTCHFSPSSGVIIILAFHQHDGPVKFPISLFYMTCMYLFSCREIVAWSLNVLSAFSVLQGDAYDGPVNATKGAQVGPVRVQCVIHVL